MAGPNVFAKTRRLIEPERTYYSLTTSCFACRPCFAPTGASSFAWRFTLACGWRIVRPPMRRRPACWGDSRAPKPWARYHENRAPAVYRQRTTTERHYAFHKGSQPRLSRWSLPRVNLDGCVHAVTCCTRTRETPSLRREHQVVARGRHELPKFVATATEDQTRNTALEPRFPLAREGGREKVRRVESTRAFAPNRCNQSQ